MRCDASRSRSAFTRVFRRAMGPPPSFETGARSFTRGTHIFACVRPPQDEGGANAHGKDIDVNTTHYPAATVSEQVETHTLSVLVDNEPGVLARVIGLFSGRGYNIESLTVSETEHEKHLSRITIVTRGTPMVIEQIKSQLDRLVPVHRVVDMTVAGPHIEGGLAMVKVRGKGDHRMEALRLAAAFRARVIDASTESFVFEITGASDKIESFVALMIPLGLVEVSRTGIVAIGRGPEGM